MSEDSFIQELRRRLAAFQQLSPSYRPVSPLYKVLRDYLRPMGLWKTKPRGKPFKPGEDERRAGNKLKP